MHEFNFKTARQNIYYSIIQKLSKKAFDSLDANGDSMMDPKEGAIWNGTVLYVIGELHRVFKIDLANYHQKNLLYLMKNIVSKWKTKSEIDTCFMGIGLSAWGELNENHLLFSQLNSQEKESLVNQLKVTREFKNNWEAFNSCIEGANTILQPQQTNTLPIHLNKIVEKYKETGYHDDTDNLGVYDSYGLMSLNYCLKAIELLDDNNPIKKKQLAIFKPHCIRYAELIKDLIYPDGSGWPFGRSVGVLGQLQYIAFLEQCLYHGFLNFELAAWARGATKICVKKMIELFWDSEKQWFCFRDEFHTCYGYRNTYPMHWDLLRYFTQIYDYSSVDKLRNQCIYEFTPTKKCKEIITDPKRKTSIFVWSDGKTQMVIPIMNSSMGKLNSDYLPKPHCRGLIEGVTEVLKPIWVPAIIISGKTYYPTNRFLTSRVYQENGWDIYEVFFDRLYETPKEESGFDGLTIKTKYLFSSNYFKRIDTLIAKEDLVIDELRMEILQAAPHPKRVEGYGKVHQLNIEDFSSNLEINLSKKIEIGNDPTYRNFFGRPSHNWNINGKNLALKKAKEYQLVVAIGWK